MEKNSSIILELKNICKRYRDPSGRSFYALDHIDLNIRKGEFICIMGPSGSGKSTLANIIGLLSTPTAGQLSFLGHSCEELADRQLTQIRNQSIGFIFQNYMLIDHMSVLDNVTLALHCHKTSRSKSVGRAEKLLKDVGLSSHTFKKARLLSGGQKQRVGIARALLKEPQLILADEPAGALDKKSRIEVLGLLQKLNRGGSTIVMVTHNEEDARAGTRMIEISDAKIVKDYPIETFDFSSDRLGA